MATTRTIFKVVLLNVMVLSVAARAFVEDQILDPEELTHFALPPPPNSSLFQWDDWKSFEATDDVKKNFHYVRSGYDKDGRMVYILDHGKIRYRELFQKSQDKIDEFEKYHEQFILRAESDAAEDDNKRIVLIIDMDEFSMINLASSKALQFMLKSFVSLVRLNHACNYGFIINVNYAAETFINLSKPFLGDFLTKFAMYGTRTEKWKPKIMRKIAASQLPPALGGPEDWKPIAF